MATKIVSTKTIPPLVSTSEDGRWILLQYPSVLQLLDNPMHDEEALHHDGCTSVVSTFRLSMFPWLSNSRSESNEAPTIDQAGFGTEAGRVLVVAAVDAFVVRWTMSAIQRGDMRPDKVKRYPTRRAAQKIAMKMISDKTRDA